MSNRATYNPIQRQGGDKKATQSYRGVNEVSGPQLDLVRRPVVVLEGTQVHRYKKHP